jgi:hypothetical protein
MPITRLDIRHTGVLILDVQDGIMSTIIDRSRVATNCAVLLKLAVTLDLPYLVCELDASRKGRTVDEVDAAMSDPSKRIERTRISAVVDLVMDELELWPRPVVLVAGVEAHIAVQQTVLDLLQRGVPCVLCRDAISGSPLEQIEPALRRMEAAGAITMDVRSATMELLRDLQHPKFDHCSGLIADLAR